ncbi:hypothetical protein BDN72DRAFT_115490 [Pluteus cervinus]|uniref:Uncharacterized protein n=1 Tax=Pluteus cervinus TaxID=181527 RepID=A0ACD3AP85_9AGAR|nr:hypothetical protein BDN72DRAFT_115490 [Pluteus cervinus]
MVRMFKQLERRRAGSVVHLPHSRLHQMQPMRTWFNLKILRRVERRGRVLALREGRCCFRPRLRLFLGYAYPAGYFARYLFPSVFYFPRFAKFSLVCLGSWLLWSGLISSRGHADWPFFELPTRFQPVLGSARGFQIWS